jgi:nicotinate dehydrogenase subunit B
MNPRIEPERYELMAGPAYNFSFGRRGFFKALGGGLVVVSYVARAQESGGGRGRGGHAMPKEIGAWLHIDEKGAVTVFTGKVEVGQNARTSLTASVAEELGAPLTSIQVVMGDTERTPFDMGTFGSMTTPQMVPQLRRVAAAARQLLPAKPWEQIDFAAVAKNQTMQTAESGAGKFKATADWKVLGRPIHKVNGREIVTGGHHYVSDMKLPGMLYGRILRPSKFEATLVSIDAGAVKPDVTVVRDGDFAGVAASNPTAAAEALAALKADWKGETQTSSKTLFADLKQTAKPSNDGASIDAAVAGADKKHSATYTIAYIAHAPLEPRAAVADWNGDKLTVWTGTQRPFGVQGELAQAFHIPESNVRVIMPDTGSGYGGKHTGETAIEAARLAKAAGKPVKVVWTREEEFTWAYFRPGGVIDVRSGISKDGRLVAWEFHNYNSGSSGINTNYEVAARKIEFHPSKAPLRQGSYRGLAATANHFAKESHMDELAAMAGLDPLEFRLRNLKDERFKGALQAAAERFGWGKQKSGNGVGFGIAAGFEKGSYVASCAEVHCESGRAPRLVRVVESFECGAILNPDQLKNQVEGSVIQGLGGALFETIDFEDGRILNPRFSKYRVPRFRDVPAIDVVLLDRKDLPPAGAGETPIVTIAPAIANAIFWATGERIRSMPLNAGAPAQPTTSGAAIF